MYANGFRDVLGKTISDRQAFENDIKRLVGDDLDNLWDKLLPEVTEKFQECSQEYCNFKVPKKTPGARKTPC